MKKRLAVLNESHISFMAMLLMPIMSFVALQMCFADIPGEHPYYLHALSDLRMARGYLEKLTPNEQLNVKEQQAIDEINAAINEIKKAAIDDGKDINDHPPIDVNLKKVGRYRKVLELLNKAHKDIKHGEDNIFAKGLRRRTLHHIGKARDIVKEIVR
jgi:hypothetical protein